MKTVGQLQEEIRALREGWRESMSDADRAFDELAGAQRGRPESAMNDIQRAAGGGVYSYVVEHGGDLTHRMSEFVTSSTRGFQYVKEKVNNLHRTMHNPYGFVKEHGENMKGNAEYYKRSLGEHLAGVHRAAEHYANEHAKLKVYNDVQWHAREHAVALGRRDFKKATQHLDVLKGAIDKGERHWKKVANEYDPNYQGPKT